ncbi:MAG: divergent polysaccharide deacetylase family protein [Leptospiraceae bacterium]|nr:divergent polysaccharide deacetylase family protein [Leptospiraceae bacterium]
MKNIVIEMFVHLLKACTAWLVLILGVSGGGWAATLEEKYGTVGRALEQLWGDDACATVYLRKKGVPIVSIACVGDYDATRREKLLDVLFRHHFELQKESYRLRPRHGVYLYKTKSGGRTVYFKLYVREARELWPRNPLASKQLALYVMNLRSSDDLLRWRTLGIPLTFSVTVGRSDTAELLARLAEYGDEKWLSIPLEDDNTEITDGELLSIADALDSEKLESYLSIINDVDGVNGISPLYCSRFCRHVPALRALLSTARNKNGEQELSLLDTTHFAGSSFYQTAKIMNFRVFTVHPMQRDFCSELSEFINLKEDNIARVLAVDAGDEKALRCLAKLSRQRLLAVEFVRLSQLAQNSLLR